MRGQRARALTTTSCSALDSRPHTRPTTRGRNGKRTLRAASNTPSAVSTRFRCSILASSSPSPTAPVTEGSHVVVHATPTYWTKRGTLQLQADEIRAVGLGELLARIEHLKRVLTAEGVFDAARKVRLPFLPRVVGLVCGRESKAEH